MISAGCVGDVMHLDRRDAVSRAFHEDTGGRGGDALAKAGDNAARDDDVLHIDLALAQLAVLAREGR